MKAGNASLKTKMKEVFESVHPPGGESDVVPGTSNKKLAFGNSVKDYSLGKEGKPAAGSPRKPVRRNSSKSAMSARDFQLQKQRNSCLEFVLVIVFMIGRLFNTYVDSRRHRPYLRARARYGTHANKESIWSAFSHVQRRQRCSGIMGVARLRPSADARQAHRPGTPPPSVTTSRPLFRLLLDSTPCFLLDFLYQPVPVVVAYNLFVYSSPHLFYLYVDWALTTTRRLGLLGQVQPSDRRIENHAAPQ